MIETSYYGSPIVRSIDRERLVSISLYKPYSLESKHRPILAPNRSILKRYKREEIDSFQYAKEFKEYLRSLNPKELYRELDNDILLCYEKIGDFCHRHIVSLWFREHGLQVKELGENRRLVISGSRTFTDYSIVEKWLEWLYYRKPFTIINSGGARGVDNSGEIFAYKYNIPLRIFIPRWDKYGKRAGMRRNNEMAKESDILFAFWDLKSRGTRHMIRYSLRRKLDVYLYSIPEDRVITDRREIRRYL